MYMENNLIPSNSFLARISSFFHKIFSRNSKYSGKNIDVDVNYSDDVIEPDELYAKVKNNEVLIEDLEDDEIDKLILNLKNKISAKEKEMSIIKSRILNIKRKINN